MPTSTSPTSRPPTGPRRSPPPWCSALLEQVEPERRLQPPAGRAEADLLGGQRLGPEAAGHRLARRQPDPLAALEVADGQRAVVVAALHPGDGLGKLDEAGGQAAVD